MMSVCGVQARTPRLRHAAELGVRAGRSAAGRPDLSPPARPAAGDPGRSSRQVDEPDGPAGRIEPPIGPVGAQKSTRESGCPLVHVMQTAQHWPRSHRTLD
jgi:hypothetical protein